MKYLTNDIPKGHLVDGLHKQTLGILAAMSSWMQIVALAHGPQEAQRIQTLITKELEADHAMP